MSFSFVANECGRSQVVVTGGPDYVVSLPIAPPHLEDFVKQGKWMCVGISVWSIHDLHAAHQAVERIKTQGGAVKLGLRPVNLTEENCRWIPTARIDEMTDHTRVGVTERSGVLEVTINGNTECSPVWVTFSEGSVVSVRYGQLADAEIDDLIVEVLSM